MDVPGKNPSLSIVIPVFNEPDWIQRSVQGGAAAVSDSNWREPEIVIVDDGSTDQTREVVDGAVASVPIRVIHTQNRGRLEARRTGIGAAQGEYILLLDARVLITRGLGQLAREVSEGRTIWNAHCDVTTGNNLMALFWDALPRMFWSEYYAHPRRLSFGIDDFVRFPKGTTCFLAPKSALLDAYSHFTTKYANPRDANDDTRLIEHLARRNEIWISPEFACLYQPRQKLNRFGPHAYHRGIVFVDAYFTGGNPYAIAIAGFCLASAAVAIASLRRPWLLPASLLGCSFAAVLAGAYKRLPSKYLGALAFVSPLFVVAYGLGIWAGLLMAARQRLRRGASKRSSTIQA